MLTKELIIGIFAAFIIMVSFGTALAEDTDKSLLGADEYIFDAPEMETDVAARNYVYNDEHLALLATEAGGEVVSTPSPLQAAGNNSYNQDRLVAAGSEAGDDWEFRFDDQGLGAREAIADKQDRDAICTNC
ncbi:MAG: hypothetical protein KAQ79_13530 [Cyclobacteriaceae bacterium]|nr:hypothetical protein [Cyclobacteriaceae bacterium]